MIVSSKHVMSHQLGNFLEINYVLVLKLILQKEDCSEHTIFWQVFPAQKEKQLCGLAVSISVSTII